MMENYRLVPRVTGNEIESLIGRLAEEINRDYEGKDILVIGILKGAVIFLADLVRKLSVPVEVDFVRLSSYGSESETSGTVTLTKDLEHSVTGRHVLIVEDIVDTGLTLRWFLGHLQHQKPESVRICALVDKLERRRVHVPLDYVGLRMEKGFIVGYGLDYSEKHRNLPGIFEVQFHT